MEKQSETELTAGVLKERSKTHNRLKRKLFNQAKQEKCAFCLVLNAHFVLFCLMKEHSVSPFVCF